MVECQGVDALGPDPNLFDPVGSCSQVPGPGA